MSHFFFDALEDGEDTPDNGGLEFGSLDTAEYEAARCAAESERDQLPKGQI
ncbi:DUF6894 family protein [Microvirga arabica]|uniref:DUF6894 family protein n=1 Tax=Microvirga arabica TaxID=1128671 RepID=A0ABV6Y9W9_9HYPH